jgi:hypothetical protein
MKDELQEFGVEVATMNSGPVSDGFQRPHLPNLGELARRPGAAVVRLLQTRLSPGAVQPRARVHTTLTALAAGEIDSYAI